MDQSAGRCRHLQRVGNTRPSANRTYQVAALIQAAIALRAAFSVSRPTIRLPRAVLLDQPGPPRPLGALITFGGLGTRREVGEAFIDIGRSNNISPLDDIALASDQGVGGDQHGQSPLTVVLLPHEFVAMCEADGVSPDEVLNGF